MFDPYFDLRWDRFIFYFTLILKLGNFEEKPEVFFVALKNLEDLATTLGPHSPNGWPESISPQLPPLPVSH